eukprot:6194267-Pleurochrysis_carterae.AAC.1
MMRFPLLFLKDSYTSSRLTAYKRIYRLDMVLWVIKYRFCKNAFDRAVFINRIYFQLFHIQYCMSQEFEILRLIVALEIIPVLGSFVKPSPCLYCHDITIRRGRFSKQGACEPARYFSIQLAWNAGMAGTSGSDRHGITAPQNPEQCLVENTQGVVQIDIKHPWDTSRSDMGYRMDLLLDKCFVPRKPQKWVPQVPEAYILVRGAFSLPYLTFSAHQIRVSAYEL